MTLTLRGLQGELEPPNWSMRFREFPSLLHTSHWSILVLMDTRRFLPVADPDGGNT